MTAKLLADYYIDHRDEELMQGLVSAGALVALADGRVAGAFCTRLNTVADAISLMCRS